MDNVYSNLKEGTMSEGDLERVIYEQNVLADQREREEKSMKLSDIRRRVREIGGISVNDAEKAHAREDTLWSDVLQAIADGDHADIDPAVLARAALKTVELSFPRW